MTAAAKPRSKDYSFTVAIVGREQSPLLNQLFRQRHFIDDEVAALFNIMDFNSQILT